MKTLVVNKKLYPDSFHASLLVLMLIVVFFYNMDTVQHMKTPGRLFSFHSLKYLLPIGLLLLMFLKADAQRTIDIYEPDYDSSYCLHSILFESLKNDPAYPVHYNQFFSATAKEKKIRRIEKTVTNRVSVLKEITEFNEDGFIISRDIEQRSRCNYYNPESKTTIPAKTLFQEIHEEYFYEYKNNKIGVKANKIVMPETYLAILGVPLNTDELVYSRGNRYSSYNEVSYNFAPLGRINNITFSKGTKYSYSYDSENNLVNITQTNNHLGNVKWTFLYKSVMVADYFREHGLDFSNDLFPIFSNRDTVMGKYAIIVNLFAPNYNDIISSSEHYDQHKIETFFVLSNCNSFFIEKIPSTYVDVGVSKINYLYAYRKDNKIVSWFKVEHWEFNSQSPYKPYLSRFGNVNRISIESHDGMPYINSTIHGKNGVYINREIGLAEKLSFLGDTITYKYSFYK